MSDWICLFIGVLLAISGIRLTIVQAELFKLQEGSSKSTPDGKSKPKYKDGDWMVQLKKPKREIIISGCKTEGDAVREILIRGHRPEEVKDIIRL